MLCAAGTSLCAEQLLAAEWQVTPAAFVGSSYADNPRLLAHGGDASAGAAGELSGVFKRLTDRSELSLRPRLYSSRYDDDRSLDSDNKFLIAGYRWLSERSEWSMELSLTRDTTLTSELGETGLVQSNRPHEASQFSVSPKIMFTERVSGGLQMAVLDSRYIDAERTGLVDYRYSSYSLFSTYALSEANSSLTVTAQGGELSVDGPWGAVTRDGSLRLGWSFRPRQLWSANLSAGPAVVSAESGSDTGMVFDADIKREAERWSMSAAIGRSQSPTGRGVLTRRDRVSAQLHRMITEDVSTTLGVQWIRNEDLNPQSRGATYHVDYGRLELAGRWRVASEWSVMLQLAANTQDYQSAPERAEGYRALMSIVWNGQPQSL